MYALYGKNKVVASVLATYLTAEFAVAIWLYATPGNHREFNTFMSSFYDINNHLTALTLPAVVQDIPAFHCQYHSLFV